MVPFLTALIAHSANIDFKAIVPEQMEMSQHNIMLSDFGIKHCSRANGSVYVVAGGTDRLGFPASVLKKFMACGLCPRGFSIRRKNGLICYKVHLMGPSGTTTPMHI